MRVDRETMATRFPGISALCDVTMIPFSMEKVLLALQIRGEWP